ncbi:hypothetical protein T190115A13A_30269 [Tenacibaculum sp. 190524A02b]|uniref:Uncharacterized protein n=1 Tax=Tenacibaculum vairaonense TaxID=3137860 RepID=A0ABP1FDN1_9FLAO
MRKKMWFSVMMLNIILFHINNHAIHKLLSKLPRDIMYFSCANNVFKLIAILV